MNQPGECTANFPGKAQVYYPTLDGLRFFAFLLVFINHLPRPEIKPLIFLHDYGWVGVHIFFALSAFLLAKILSTEYQQYKKISVVKFYIRRGLRIWPLYYVFLLASLVASFAFGMWEDSHISRLVGLLLFADNILTGIYDFNTLPFAAHLWTISLEEQFYIALPFLLRYWLSDYRKIVTRLMVLWMVFILLRLFCVVYMSPDLNFLIWTALFSADALLFGTILGAIAWKPNFSRFAKNLLLAGGIAGIFSASAFEKSLFEHGFHQVFIYSFIGLGSVFLIMSALCDERLSFLTAKPLRYLGKISYGLYVFHMFGISASMRLEQYIGLDNWWFVAFTALALTVVPSVLSYELFERKFLHLKQRYELLKTRPI